MNVQRFFRKLSTPAGIACAVAVVLLLLAASVVVAAAPASALALLGGLPLVGMALTPTTGEVYDKQIVGGRRAGAGDASQPIQYVKFKRTDTATGTGTCLMGILPAGPIRILNNLSGVSHATAADAALTLSVGYGEHYNSANTLVAADTTYFVTGVATPTVDPSAGAGPTPFNLPAVGYSDFNTRDGLPISITSAGGNITTGEVTEVLIAFQAFA